MEEEKERGIRIIHAGQIGHLDFNAQIMHHAINEKIDVVVIEEAEIDNSFEINGVRYQQKENQSNKSVSRFSKLAMMASMFYVSKLAMMASMFYDSAMFGGKKNRQLPKGIDIVKEFELIQNKQSNLSKWERDQVEHIFHLNFNKI